MRLKYPDLALSIAIALADVAWVVLPGHVPVIGLALALPLVFVLPGYTLTAALFHGRSLDIVHRMLLSLGVSLAIDIPGGLLLNVFPVGLRSSSWSALLALLTIVFAGLVVYLRRGMTLREKRLQRLHLRWHDYIVFGLASAVVMLSIVFSAASVAQQPQTGFTQLWLLPPGAGTQNCAVQLGIQSYELRAQTYHIDMTANGAQVNRWPLLALAPRQKWERLVPVDSYGGGIIYIEVRLYRADNLQVVYREVNVTLHMVGKTYCQ